MGIQHVLEVPVDSQPADRIGIHAGVGLVRVEDTDPVVIDMVTADVEVFVIVRTEVDIVGHVARILAPHRILLGVATADHQVGGILEASLFRIDRIPTVIYAFVSFEYLFGIIRIPACPGKPPLVDLLIIAIQILITILSGSLGFFSDQSFQVLPVLLMVVHPSLPVLEHLERGSIGIIRSNRSFYDLEVQSFSLLVKLCRTVCLGSITGHDIRIIACANIQRIRQRVVGMTISPTTRVVDRPAAIQQHAAHRDIVKEHFPDREFIFRIVRFERDIKIDLRRQTFNRDGVFLFQLVGRGQFQREGAGHDVFAAISSFRSSDRGIFRLQPSQSDRRVVNQIFRLVSFRQIAQGIDGLIRHGGQVDIDRMVIDRQLLVSFIDQFPIFVKHHDQHILQRLLLPGLTGPCNDHRRLLGRKAESDHPFRYPLARV